MIARPLLKKASLIVSLLIGLFVLNQILTYTLYNPALMVPLYKWGTKSPLLTYVLKLELLILHEPEVHYPLIAIDTINRGLFWGPRAAVEGEITINVNVFDGDHHYNIEDAKGHTLVLEEIPEYPIKPIPLHTKVKVWGITRYDMEHRWWEIHPILGWELLNN